MRQKPPPFRRVLESLEQRLCLAGSVGWDGPGRGAATLTYYIGAAPASLDQATVDAALQMALNAWSSVANIKFKPTETPHQLRSLDLTFRPIDGEGGILAQGFLPADVNPARIAGDVRFDSLERWEVGNDRGSEAFDLVQVAVHEIGHALGLEHSSVAGSVMVPVISPTQSYIGLAPADVQAIRSLYAPPRPATTLSKSATLPIPTTETKKTPAKPPARPHPRPRIPRSWRPRAIGAGDV